jgi:hypothetical protein
VLAGGILIPPADYPGIGQKVAAAGLLPADTAEYVLSEKEKWVPFDRKSGRSERYRPEGDRGDLRGVNEADKPEAVKLKFDQMVGSLHLKSPSEAETLKREFAENLQTIKDNFKGDDLAQIMRSMNLMMEKGNHFIYDKNQVNAVAGLAARGAAWAEANRQGANPTCALTSESRVEQQRNFVKYANQMASVAVWGGAYRGGEHGTKRIWVNIDAAE